MENDSPDISGIIAVVGMACRFPKAPNIERYWSNLESGVDCITHFSHEELLDCGIDLNLLSRPNYIRAKAYLENADMFDHKFFNYSENEAKSIDPQQRLFLETAWHALESAACDPYRFDGKIGVFAGSGINTNIKNMIKENNNIKGDIGDLQLLLSLSNDFLSTRVSYKLNLTGPSMTIQTGCSTGLVAISLACQSLLTYQCDAAIAGAVSLSYPRKHGYLYNKGGILSSDGYCRPFDAIADGTVPGEGVGAIVLMRLEDALTRKLLR